MPTHQQLKSLSITLEGSLFYDELHKSMYATDASVYRKKPLAVAIPESIQDLQAIIHFAKENNTTLIPRAAGTSLAGQCVGDGIIVDISKHFNKIISFDQVKQTITVEPGIIRDDLNHYLKPFGLFFGPNTSTSNRCMIGGMVGNNSSGTTSIQFGVTRDKISSLKTLLSDASEVEFSNINSNEFIEKTELNTLEGTIYKTIYDELSNPENQLEIHNEFPKKSIHRRNTGYAIDSLLTSDLFGGNKPTINLSKLLCGSEGTLAFTTEITLKLDPLPPKESVLVAAHFNSVQESMEAVVIAMKHNLFMCELMDKTILDCTKNNREHLHNRFFINSDPEAILMLEVSADTIEEATIFADTLIKDLQQNNFGYAFPKLTGNDIDKAFSLRKAGLGLLGNMIGDKKAVACIEDTAVELSDLPNYIKEFTKMMDEFGQKAVYYAHAGAGEIHLRPILNLKKKEDVVLFRKITTETAKLVKKYKGSFSGEHGDGIVRSEFIPMMIGHKNYQLLKRIKKTFDKNTVFNKGKIIDPLLMDESLRYTIDRDEPKIGTLFDFSDSEGILKATEKCNGSGDCRKSVNAGGTMCPSYRATKNEQDTTRARANTLREFLTNSDKPNKFNNRELKEVFSLCLSCKACATECPSNVDVATLKAEFSYQYQKENKPKFRDKLFGFNAKYNELGSKFPRITNFILQQRITKKIMGFAVQRNIPKLGKYTLRKWYAEKYQKNNSSKKVYLFCDEFSNYNDVKIGIDTIQLLSKLGFEVLMVSHLESGRSLITEGFLDEFKIIANKNIATFKDLISEDTPLIGIEPTPILTFRDEYLRVANNKKNAKKLAKNCLTIEEFIQLQIKNKVLSSSNFTSEKREVKIHGHCHQKALIGMNPAFEMMSIPENYTVTIINSGCCGLAGSFGFKKEHYDLSMQIGEDTLFPKVRNYKENTIIVASGTSCRQQIHDGTKRGSLHPSTVLLNALKN